jgi:Replication-relaxation
VDHNRRLSPANPAAGPRRGGGPTVADEMRRIMPRDRWLLGLLDQHQTLTTEQIAAIAFPTLRKARRRLLLLHQRGVLDRFRHAVRPGSQSWRWTLGPLGAAIVAAGNGDPTPRPAAVRARTDRLATSPRLAHLLGTNQVFCALAAHARHHPKAELARWWPERRAAQACGNLVRPDGHGVWVEHGRRVPFWLEYDLGTEVLSKVADKLTGYARLATTDLAYPVLFWLPTTAREDHLHRLLARTNVGARVSVATAATDHAADLGPAARVWRLAGGTRVRLADIPTTPGTPGHRSGAPWDG